MQTFSVNISTPVEATSFPLPENVNNLLANMPDNESRLISARVLRDSMLSLWSSVPFKYSDGFIGLDAFNPNDRDIKFKIVLGKRSWTPPGLSYSINHDLMNDGLISNDVDIFVYNTKRDNVNNSTRMSILAGGNPGLFQFAPYIQSELYFSVTQSNSLNFIAPSLSATISISSLYSTASINSIVFPTILNSGASASNSKVLKWENSRLVWDWLTFPVTDWIGQTGSPVRISGNPINVNGWPVTFTDTRKVPVAFGDITPGSSFNSYPLVETLRRMIYPYIQPQCSLSIASPFSSGYTEVGTSPIPTINWTLVKRTNNLLTTSLTNMIPGVYPPITGSGQITVTGSSTGIVISPISATSTEFRVTVYDGVSYASASTNLTGIYPYFYGYSDLNTMTTIGLSTLQKDVSPSGDKDVFLSGTGSIYFIYDSNYGTLSNIYDNFGNTASGSFSQTLQTLSSPSGLWAGKQFLVYRWSSAPDNLIPVNFQFRY